MSDFQTVCGFEDVWRAPVLPPRRTARAILALRSSGAGGEVRARLARVAGRTPEVMVKVTGRTRDPGHLRAHLDYISRSGELEVEDRDGALITGRPAVREFGRRLERHRPGRQPAPRDHPVRPVCGALDARRHQPGNRSRRCPRLRPRGRRRPLRLRLCPAHRRPASARASGRPGAWQ